MVDPIAYYRERVTCEEDGCASTTWHPHLTPLGAVRRCPLHVPPTEPLPALLPLEPLDLFLLRSSYPLCTHSECPHLGRHRFAWPTHTVILCDDHLLGAEAWGKPGERIVAHREPLAPHLALLWPKVAFRDAIDRKLHSMGILDPEDRLRVRAKWASPQEPPVSPYARYYKK